MVPVGEAVNNIHGMITLNETAQFIWQALENGKEFDEILALLKAEYDAPEEVLKSDLAAFTDKLIIHNILEK